MGRVRVDIPAVKKYIRDNGMTQADICKRIGRSPNFLCSSTGDMADYTYELLISALGVERDFFKKKESPKQQEAHRGGDLYTLGLEVSPDVVVLKMYFQWTEICRAASRVKGTRELDLMQAVSYAAHMMYKFTEQKELDKER